MRIGIDARMYGPKQGGLGRYIEQLIIHLEPLLGNDELVVFLRHDNWDLCLPRGPKIKKVLADIPWYGLAEQFHFPKIITAEKLDLMHFPHWNVPLRYHGRFVVTVHDLLLIHYPTRAASTLGPLTYWIKNLGFRASLRHAVRDSSAIIAPSEYTKSDIVATCHVAPEKITVTYQGATPLTKNSTTPATILQKYHITKPFILYVGVAYPHKNLDGLVCAWQLFEKTYGGTHQLVLVGKRNYFYNRLITSTNFQACHNIIYTDFVPDDELVVLYETADLFVTPSLYEGYTLPSLEAIAHGLPVVASNATCLPEVLGAAALYFDPTNHAAMATTIHQGITDHSWREKSRMNGTKLLNKYSALTMAAATIALYHKTVDNQA